jgi:hypothetical protein
MIVRDMRPAKSCGFYPADGIYAKPVEQKPAPVLEVERPIRHHKPTASKSAGGKWLEDLRQRART